jgi:hypothetical protein
VDECLKLRVADITPAVINDDGTFGNWKGDGDFQALLKKYAPTRKK